VIATTGRRGARAPTEELPSAFARPSVPGRECYLNDMTSKRFSLVFVLAFCIVLSGITPVSAQRERRTDAPQKPATLPVVQASPSPTPPTPTPEASPTPAVVIASTPTASLVELQSRITQILQKPELAPALVGVKVVSVDSGKVIFESNAAKLLRPASNMKLYTVAAALDRLSPDFRFSTSVYAKTRPNSAGVVRGDLTIFGRGDPSLAARFNNGDYFKGINDLAARIAEAGVKRIEGDLVGDESYFVGPKYGSGWEWEDLTWYYGAEVSSLTINDNALDLFVKPAVEVGKPALITTGPPDPLLTIVNQVTTGAKGTRRQLSVHRGLNENTVTVTGSIAVDDRGYTGGIGISHPALLFVYLLRSALAQKGVVITGKSRTVGEVAQAMLPTNVTVTNPGSQLNQVEITSLQSPPFSVVAAQTLKPSQNLYTELILRTLGKVTPPPPATSVLAPTSEDLGLEAVKSFLKTVGISPDSLVLSDGSGLSRNDMITAEASVELLLYMARHRYAEVFRNALPIAGVDGTLRNRMRGTTAENNLRAKTGSLSSAASLGGYVTTAAGEKLAFSIMVNNYPSDVEPRTVCIDPIAVLLASFNGKSE
jgi:D-alanyl-D-alanine carboxypeptidase/D-alanyl-D-alanine-endopeptidase (penicillin-binding protein 4)